MSKYTGSPLKVAHQVLDWHRLQDDRAYGMSIKPRMRKSTTGSCRYTGLMKVSIAASHGHHSECRKSLPAPSHEGVVCCDACTPSGGAAATAQVHCNACATCRTLACGLRTASVLLMSDKFAARTEYGCSSGPAKAHLENNNDRWFLDRSVPASTAQTLLEATVNCSIP
jgi:hypothetical protein